MIGKNNKAGKNGEGGGQIGRSMLDELASARKIKKLL